MLLLLCACLQATFTSWHEELVAAVLSIPGSRRADTHAATWCKRFLLPADKVGQLEGLLKELKVRCWGWTQSVKCSRCWKAFCAHAVFLSGWGPEQGQGMHWRIGCRTGASR
jgi:hypothetical protein